MISVYNVIGLMSGTSLDGLDIAYCSFNNENGKWSFKIKNAVTQPYSETWLKKLSTVDKLNAIEFIALHNDYGYYLGKAVKDFIDKNDVHPDFIASHGHTVFHQPAKKITFQLGNGDCIAAETGVSVVSDFRTMDVALGGQGAPLVPIGDSLLFTEFDYCVNLGGFANLSYQQNMHRIAYDICPFNIILNKLAKEAGYDFDDKGKMAAQGFINQTLLDELNNMEFYALQPPKSLGREWLEHDFLPIINKFNIAVHDKLRTVAEHIVFQILNACETKVNAKILFTGGGTFNDFIMHLIETRSYHKIVIPDKQLINFKEALIFAFLGVLRYRNEINCLKSVTGASIDNSGGKISLQ
jgi:anhydro-N-acetylmuramic acid kinase